MKLSTTRTVLTTALGLCLFAPTVGAQGANSCSNADPISGTGTFNFDTATATTDGQLEGVWTIPGVDQIENDVWFRWIAPTTSVYEISTDHYPLTHGATAIAIYKYGCSSSQGRAIVGRMGNVGLAVVMEFGTEAGTEYVIRIGTTHPLNRPYGIFTLNEVSPPASMGTAVNPANGRTYHILEASSWSVAQAAAANLGGNLVTVSDQAEQDWLKQTFHSWGGTSRSLWLGYNDAAIEGTWTWVSGEAPSYENWSVISGGGPPNNGNQYEHYAHLRSDWADGTWNDLIGDPAVGFFYSSVHGVVEIGGALGTPFCFGDGLGGALCPCGNHSVAGNEEGCSNGTGLGAKVAASGGPSVSGDSLVLTVSQAVPSEFGIFVQNVQSVAPTPFYNGLLCLAADSHLIRHYAPPSVQPTTTDAAGTGSNAQLMTTGDYLGDTQPGVTVYYQFWGRDNTGACGTGANFSSGISIQWLP